MLSEDTVVATIMSNSGLFAALERAGIKCEQTTVGDRFVYERMQENGYNLGGEQSGHIIFREYATTGDGELTAVQFLSIIKELGVSVSSAASEITQYPQIMINVKVENDVKEAVLGDWAVKEVIRDVEEALGEDGRILVRPSGTEPLVRVMVEGKAFDEVSALAGRAADKISQISKEKKASKK